MRFGPSDEQALLQASLERALDRLCTVPAVAAAIGGDRSAIAAMEGAFTTFGGPALLVPEEHGGAGLGLFEAALVAELLGRYAAPVPFLGTAVLAPLALTRAGSEAQRARWLPRLATGEIKVAAALGQEAGGAGLEGGLRGRERPTGTALFVLDANGADAALVVRPDKRLMLVPIGREGVTLRLLASLDQTRPLGELTLADADAEDLPGQDARTLQRLVQVGRVLLAADTLGAAQRLLDLAVGHASSRVQFGRAIGSFQAVQHLCAEMAAALEPCRALVWYAAHALDTDRDDAALAALHCKAHVCDVGRRIARGAVEIHGAMGFAAQSGLHHWTKRITANRRLLGGPERLRHEAAVLQGLGQRAA